MSSPRGPTRRQAARRRVRGHGRCRRLLVLSVRRLPGSGAGRLDPARALRAAAAALPHHLGLHQQAADPALSRRGADRRVLRHGNDARRAGAPARHQRGRQFAWPISCRRRRCPTAIWSARCSTAAIIPSRCAARWRRSTSTAIRARQASGRDGRLRPRHLLRAGRARHLGLSRLGHSLRAGLRAGLCAAQPRRRAGGARRRAQPWPRAWRRRLAQVAHEILGIDPDKVRVVHGDTALTPYSTGTWGSRCMVMAGGAVAEACRQLGEQIAAIGAALLQVQACGGRVVEGGKVRRKDAMVRKHRRRRPHLVSRAAEPAARRRQGRAGDHGRLSARS